MRCYAMMIFQLMLPRLDKTFLEIHKEQFLMLDKHFIKNIKTIIKKFLLKVKNVFKMQIQTNTMKI